VEPDTNRLDFGLVEVGGVEVFNLLGERVALLQDPPHPGFHTFTFEGTHLASGLYLIRASSPAFGSLTRKAMLIRLGERGL